MSEKKKWFCVLGVVAAACVLAGALIYGMTLWMRNEELKNESSVVEQTEEYLYRVSVYRGHIGIYDGDGSLKSEVIVSVDQLPQSDQKQLKEGILINSEEELYTLMEDYTG